VQERRYAGQGPACQKRFEHGLRDVVAQNLILPNRRVIRIFAAMNETLLDVKGMNCPLPVLKANRSLRGMAAGERLRVLATDRAAVADFQAFCRETGHALLAWSEEAGVFSFVIRRRADEPEKKGS
jgi:tRNA 2-thiouridine synthesizing protein A